MSGGLIGGGSVRADRGSRAGLDTDRLTRTSPRSIRVTAVVVVSLLSAVALAACQGGTSNAPAPGPDRAAPRPGHPTQPTVAVPQGAGGQKRLTIWLTGYSWQDNTPPGSSVVGEPVLHQTAGGSGTSTDPITVAVPGHQGQMAWAPGTRFYLPTVQRYVIVEDSGAAAAPPGDDTHLDMWIGGQDGTTNTTNDCEDTLTGTVAAIVNPPTNEPVMPGPIFTGGKCNIPPQDNTDGTYTTTPNDHHHHDGDGDGDGGN